MGTSLSDKILGCWNLAGKNGPVERGDEGHVAWVAQLQPIRHQRPSAAVSVKVLGLLYNPTVQCDAGTSDANPFSPLKGFEGAIIIW